MIFSSVVAMVLAVLIGVSLGVLGGGGSLVTFPMLVYVARVPAKEAVGMSTAIVGATSLFGAIIQWRRGNVEPKAALLFSVVGMAGTFVGSGGTHLLSRKSLLLIFAGVMFIAALVMLRGRVTVTPADTYNIPRCLTVGFIVGLLTGFLGVGGGFLIVPALVLAAGLKTRMAAGTSLAVIALNSTTGLLGQLRYVRIDWMLLAGFLVLAFAGMLTGIRFARNLHEDLLRRLFGAALIVLAVVITALNF